MKVLYDPDHDTMRILFRSAPIDRSVVEVPGLIVDYDTNGAVIGLELAEASRHIHDPRTVDFQEHPPVAAAPNEQPFG